ncbi:MAG: ribosomal small subunit methyltransferase [Flaviaesturariibacter sp.]|nr:ribosomal small subunit methyltransferase [Flaviaesturariibacter sp.]
MAAPYFFIADISSNSITLDENTSKHIVSVLRMLKGEELLLTDGKGTKAKAIITDDNRKRCQVQVLNRTTEPTISPKVSIAISLIKNASRFEWFLEKATEIGITEIIPLLCERTEKEKFRYERLNGILISAMLQSQQYWLPVLHEPLPFNKVIQSSAEQKFIAHCEEGKKQQLTNQLINRSAEKLILIGPEGDFTSKEIEAALAAGYEPVALGNTRLRTETAGMVAATLLRLV